MREDNLRAFNNGWAKGPYHFIDPTPGYFSKNLGTGVGVVILKINRPLKLNSWTIVCPDWKFRQDFKAKTAEDAVKIGLGILSDHVSGLFRVFEEQIKSEIELLNKTYVD